MPILHLGDTTYVLSSGDVHRYVSGRLDGTWHYDAPELPAEVAAWVRRFWKALGAAPTHTVREDQWVSEYLTVKDRTVFRWRDDRHEFSNYLDGVTPIEAFAPPDEATAEWLRSLR